MLPRLHLFEFEDLSWFPSKWRRYGTDYLTFVAHINKMWKPAIPLIEAGLASSKGGQTIVDLASGSGGYWIHLSHELKRSHPRMKVLLTDWFPNTGSMKRNASKCEVQVDVVHTRVNALRIPRDLSGLRTMFLSFHHFPKRLAKHILRQNVHQNQPILILEGQSRSILNLLFMCLSPIMVLLMTPFIKPLEIGRLFWTYIIPVVPILVLWDGVVSVLRTYTPQELLEMTHKIDPQGVFNWKTGTLKNGPATLTFLLGTPRKKETF